MNDFATVTNLGQIATALLLIVFLLLYIAFRLSEEKKRASKKT